MALGGNKTTSSLSLHPYLEVMQHHSQPGATTAQLISHPTPLHHHHHSQCHSSLFAEAPRLSPQNVHHSIPARGGSLRCHGHGLFLQCIYPVHTHSHNTHTQGGVKGYKASLPLAPEVISCPYMALQLQQCAQQQPESSPAGMSMICCVWEISNLKSCMSRSVCVSRREHEQ